MSRRCLQSTHAANILTESVMSFIKDFTEPILQRLENCLDAGTPLEVSKRRLVVPILYGQSIVWTAQIFFMCKPSNPLACTARVQDIDVYHHIKHSRVDCPASRNKLAS